MRNKIINVSLATCLLLSALCSCSNDEVYDTAVVKDISVTCDGEPWSIYFGTTARNLFIYNGDGSYNANFSMLYPLNLNSGNYQILCTDQVGLLNDSVNIGLPLSEVRIPQDTLAKTKFAVSLPTLYSSPSSSGLNIAMETRTGLLRLKATDQKADKRYTNLRATVNSPITAYNVGDGTYSEGSVSLNKERSTSNGGINYAEDFTLLATEINGKTVTVNIDYMNDAKEVLWTKTIDGEFTIMPNDTVQVSFALNNGDEPMIQDFTVQIASEGWNDVDVNPGAPVLVPDGFTYVSPADNINDVFNTLKADDTVDEIKLYLKAGETYAFDGGTLENLPKSLCIRGQVSNSGAVPTVTFPKPISFSGTMDEVRFENLNVDGKDRFFKFKNQEFHIGTLAFVNCWFDSFNGTMWYQETNADYQQVVDNLLIEDTRFANLTLGKSALFGLSNKKVAPIYNWTFRNSTFHTVSMNASIVNNLNKTDKTITMQIENCTFVNNAGTKSLFDLNVANSETFNLSVSNCLFTGTVESTSDVFSIKNAAVQNIETSKNYYTNGYVVSSWGLDNDPEQAAETISELMTDPASGDFTIKATSSAVYTEKIGDNYWIK